MLRMDILESAFAEVEQIGKGECTFDVGGTPITLRVLLPNEEAHVREVATQAYPTSEEAVDDASSQENLQNVFRFMNDYKLTVLSYAVCQVGDTDLRDELYVETGENLPNGKPVKISRQEAMRKIILRWSIFVRDGCFRKYKELIDEVEKKAESAISFKPADLESEIERLQARLGEIQAQKESENSQNSHLDLVRQIDDMGNPVQAEAAPQADSEPLAPPAPQAAPPVPQGRQPVIPQAVPAPPPVQKNPAPPQQAGAPTRNYAEESIVGGDDLEAAVASENQRLFAQRMQRMQGAPVVQQPSSSALDAKGRVPPHLGALDVADSLLPKDPVARVGDNPVFRLEPNVEEMGVPRPMGASAPSQINPGPQGRVNPRFRPSKP